TSSRIGAGDVAAVGLGPASASAASAARGAEANIATEPSANATAVRIEYDDLDCFPDIVPPGHLVADPPRVGCRRVARVQHISLPAAYFRNAVARPLRGRTFRHPASARARHFPGGKSASIASAERPAAKS